jgi:hypothetical protein
MFEWPKFIAHAEAAFLAAPFLASIDLHDTNKRDIREILDHPMYANVRGLDFPLGEASLKVAIDRRQLPSSSLKSSVPSSSSPTSSPARTRARASPVSSDSDVRIRRRRCSLASFQPRRCGTTRS